MSVFYSLLKKTAFFLLCAFCAVSISNAVDSTPEHGDVQDGAVPGFVVYHGRMYRDGAPYTGNAQIGIRIYSSTDTASIQSSCYCDTSANTCDSIIPSGVSGCIWKSTPANVSVTQGLFSVEVQIPIPVLSFQGGNSRKKAYEMVSYVEGDPVSISSGTTSGNYPLLDTIIYAYSAKALEEKTTVVLSTLALADGGDIYLDGGGVCFYHTESHTQTCQTNAEGVKTNILKSDGYVYGHAQKTTSFYSGAANYNSPKPSELAMFISQEGNVGLGTNSPDKRLQLSKNGTSGIDADLSVSAIYPYIGNDSFSNSDDIQIGAGLNVSTITKISGAVVPGGLYFTDKSIRLKSSGSPVENQMILKTVKVGSSSKQQVLVNSGNMPGINSELAVDGVIHSARGFLAGDIHIEKNLLYNEIYLSTDSASDVLYLQPGANTGNVIIGPNDPVANGGKLQVSAGGIKTDALEVTGNAVLNSASGISHFNSEFFVATKAVEVILSTTEIHGNLRVVGESSISDPAYVNKENTFNQDTNFRDNVIVSGGHNLTIAKSLAVSGGSFVENREEDKGYLQIGDASTSFSDKDAFLALNAKSGNAGSIAMYRKNGGSKDLSASIASVNLPKKSLTAAAGGNMSVESIAGEHAVYGSTFSAGTAFNAYTDFRDSNGNYVGHPVAVFGNADTQYLIQKVITDPSSVARDNVAAVIKGKVVLDSIRFRNGSGSDVMRSAYVGPANPSEIHVDSNNNNGVAEIHAINGSVILQNASSKVAYITPGGNVGIGVVNPSHLLTISEDAGGLLAGSNSFPDSSIKLKGNNITINKDLKTTAGGIYTGSVERISSAGSIRNSVWNGTVIDVAHGGTGLDSYAIKNSTGIFKGNGSGSVRIEKLNFANADEITGNLKIDNGGTGLPVSAPGAGETGMLAINSSGNIVRAKLKAGSEVSDILPADKGGTGINLPSDSGIMRNYGDDFNIGKIDLSSGADVSGVLGVPNGGIGKVLTVKGLIYSPDSSSIAELALSPGNPVLGSPDKKPYSMSDESWQLSNISKHVENDVIHLSIPQDVSSSAQVEFAGLKFNDPHLVSGVLQIDPTGTVSTRTIELKDILDAPLLVDNGGTNSASLSTGPVRYAAGIEAIVAGSGQKLNIAGDSTEIEGILSQENGGTGFADYDRGEFLVASGDGTFEKMQLPSGYVFIGNTGDYPSIARITSNSGRINVASSGGSIDFDLPQSISTDSAVNFRNMSITNLSSGFLKTDNDGNVSNQAKINLPGNVENMLSVANGGLGEYQDLSGTAGLLYNYGVFAGTVSVNLSSEANVSGLLPFSHGGLNNNFSSGHGLIKAGADSASVALLNLNSDSGDYKTDTVLGMSNGGTGVSILPASDGVVKSSGTVLYKEKLNLDSGETSGILEYGQGGTSLAGYTANSVIYSADGSIGQLQLQKGQLLMQDSNGIIAGNIIPDDNSFNVDDQTESGKIKLSLNQDIGISSDVEFEGMSITGTDFNAGILYADSDGKISTATLIIDDYLTEIGTVPVERGGTGLDLSVASGPLINDGVNMYVGQISLSTSVANTLQVANGGTGIDKNEYSTGILVKDSGKMNSVALGDGQLLVGTAAGKPAAVSVQDVPNQTIRTMNAGSLSVGLVQDIHDEAVPEFAGINISGQSGFLKSVSGSVYAYSKIRIPEELSDSENVFSPELGGTGKTSATEGLLRFINNGFYGNSKAVISGENKEVSGMLQPEHGGLGKDFAGSEPGILVYEDNGAGKNEFFVKSIDFSYTTGNLPVSKGGTGRSTIENNKVLTINSDSEYSFTSVAPFKMLGTDSDGVPASVGFVSDDGIIFSTETFSSGVAAAISLPQPLSQDSAVTFAGLALSSFTASGDQEFLKINPSGSGDSLSVSEISASDISAGTVSVANGGTGINSIEESVSILYYSTVSASLVPFHIPNQNILMGGASAPFGVLVKPDASMGMEKELDVDFNTNVVTFRTKQRLIDTSAPSFSGLTVSSVKNAPALLINSSGMLSSYDTVLSTSQGGTGLSSLPHIKGFITTDENAALQSVHQFEAGKFAMGSASSALVNREINMNTDKGLTATFSSDEISLEFDQDSLRPDGNARFENVALSTEPFSGHGNVSARLFNVPAGGTMTVQNELENSGGFIAVSTLTVNDLFNVPVSSTPCVFSDNGVSGQIKFCPLKRANVVDPPSDFKKIVIFSSGIWRCINNIPIGNPGCQ